MSILRAMVQPRAEFLPLPGNKSRQRVEQGGRTTIRVPSKLIPTLIFEFTQEG